MLKGVERGRGEGKGGEGEPSTRIKPLILFTNRAQFDAHLFYLFSASPPLPLLPFTLPTLLPFQMLGGGGLKKKKCTEGKGDIIKKDNKEIIPKMRKNCSKSKRSEIVSQRKKEKEYVKRTERKRYRT